MGIPGLTPWIAGAFDRKQALYYFLKGERTFRVHNVYIDASGPLHEAAQKEFQYGAFKSDKFDYRGYEQRELETFSTFFDYILAVLEIVQPEKVLYMAIDGPPPRMKRNQQRSRRFIAAEERKRRLEAGEKVLFDSNAITPGTMFMAQFTRYAQTAIRRWLNNIPKYRHLKVIFSPASCPGEGEHKIMDYIRKEGKRNESHCMYGPDADLIMLCLATHFPKMFLLKKDIRSAATEENAFIYMDVGKMGRELPGVLGLWQDRTNNPLQYSSKRTYREVEDDFIFQGFFVGNDFLPRIQMFHHLHDGMKQMIKVYAKTSNESRINFLTIQGKINIQGFKAFVNELAKHEQAFLVEQIITVDERKQPPSEEYVNVTLQRNVNKVTHTMNFENYRKEYYQKFHIKRDQVPVLCEAYLLTFACVFDYYTRGLPSWTWSYDFYYAPLMRDFAAYLEHLDQATFNKLYAEKVKKGEPFPPFEQLIAVLPTASADLLPPEYAALLHKGELVSKGYFPSKLVRDYEGKLKEHEAPPVSLAFMDDTLLEKEYTEIKPARKYDRNTITGPHVFEYDKNYTASYTSDMGNIPLCHVVKKPYV